MESVQVHNALEFMERISRVAWNPEFDDVRWIWANTPEFYRVLGFLEDEVVFEVTLNRLDLRRNTPSGYNRMDDVCLRLFQTGAGRLKLLNGAIPTGGPQLSFWDFIEEVGIDAL